MTYVDIDYSENILFKKTSEEIIRNIINKVCEVENLPFDTYVSVIITTKDEIREINVNVPQNAATSSKSKWAH